jgi:uncharacterized membrane protein YadS
MYMSIDTIDFTIDLLSFIYRYQSSTQDQCELSTMSKNQCAPLFVLYFVICGTLKSSITLRLSNLMDTRKYVYFPTVNTLHR